MPIAGLVDIHNMMNTPVTDTTNDVELNYWLTPAEAILLQWYKAFGGQGSLPTDQALIIAESALTIWLFRRVREAPAVAQAFMDIAREAFNAYKEGTLRYPQAPGISPHESVSSSETTGRGA